MKQLLKIQSGNLKNLNMTEDDGRAPPGDVNYRRLKIPS